MKWTEIDAGADARGERERGYAIDEAFIARIHEQAARVPAGCVSTYGIIAALAGYPGAARECGFAMSQVAPTSGIAAHRIVNAKGEMAPDGVFGGREIQRALLSEEGVPFKPDGAIDMAACVWPPEEAAAFRPAHKPRTVDDNQLSFDW